ncbi:Alpha/beta hydrolase domain-containing protein 4 [Balamuthia mandrillaris]
MLAKARWRRSSAEHLFRAEHALLQRLTAQFESRVVEIEEGVFINTVTLGTGTPLVLLHGFGGGLALWLSNLEALGQRHQVYALDLLGFGRSSRPPLKATTAAEAEHIFVESLEQWRIATGLQQFTLVGHSFGGYIAFCYCLKYGAPTIKRLVLVEPWGVSSSPKTRVKIRRLQKKRNKKLQKRKEEHSLTKEERQQRDDGQREEHVDDAPPKLGNKKNRIAKTVVRHMSPFSPLRTAGPLGSFSFLSLSLSLSLFALRSLSLSLSLSPSPSLTETIWSAGPLLVKSFIEDMFGSLTFSSEEEGQAGQTNEGQKASPVKKKYSSYTNSLRAQVLLYIYHINAQTPATGERLFRKMLVPLNWAVLPLVDRAHLLPPSIPITFIHGTDSAMSIQPSFVLKAKLQNRVSILQISKAGHHVFIDNPKAFNHELLRVMSSDEPTEDPQKEEEDIHSSYQTHEKEEPNEDEEDEDEEEDVDKEEAERERKHKEEIERKWDENENGNKNEKKV